MSFAYPNTRSLSEIAAIIGILAGLLTIGRYLYNNWQAIKAFFEPIPTGQLVISLVGIGIVASIIVAVSIGKLIGPVVWGVSIFNLSMLSLMILSDRKHALRRLATKI